MALELNENSFVSIDDADVYFETRIDSKSWDDASDELKEDALVTATQIIDNHSWIGSAVSSSQALAWPRKNAIYYDDRMGQEIKFSESETPAAVKTAVYEQALHLLNNEDLLAGTVQNFESISVGSIKITDSNNDVVRTSIKPSSVMKYIRPLLSRGSTNSWWRAN